MSDSLIQCFIRVPVVNCDLCRHNSYWPDGVRPSVDDPERAPQTLSINLLPLSEWTAGPYTPIYSLATTLTSSDVIKQAHAKGWRTIWAQTRKMFICPDCLRISSKIASGTANAPYSEPTSGTPEAKT